MYLQVQLLNGFRKPLLYNLPSHLADSDIEGKIIYVPFKKAHLPALVLKRITTLTTAPAFAIRSISSVQNVPCDLLYHSFITLIANYYFLEPIALYHRMLPLLATHEKSCLLSPAEKNNEKASPFILPSLTEEQQRVVDFLSPKITTPSFTPTLLHGVTGSGKTEVYAALIKESLQQNKSVLLLIPEVSLSIQFQKIFRAKIPAHIPIFSFHSATAPQEKNILWKTLLTSQAALIIGVHLPIFLPLCNLGLIIIDEEHELNFQEKKHPKLCSKQVALLRAKHYGIPILLGSATPCLQSLYAVKQGQWKFFQLTKRFQGAFPTIKTVFLKNEKKTASFWITPQLKEEIQKRLDKKEQTLIYINRRGFSFFVMCTACPFIFSCNNCSVSLTLHHEGASENVTGQTFLRCHYCNFTRTLPAHCPGCNKGEDTFLKKGIGTQQMVLLLKKMFPQAIIERADLDTTRKRTSWSETVKKFERNQIDILVGTQTITKGYHFPHVTLVGVIWGDLNAHFPIYNANERALQQLLQVAGRAGRNSPESTVIIQVMHPHPILSYLDEINYLAFYKEEIQFRVDCSYPPVGFFITLELNHSNPVIIEKESRELFEKLTAYAILHKHEARLLGPTKPPLYKVQKIERRIIIIKALHTQPVRALTSYATHLLLKSRLFVIFNS